MTSTLGRGLIAGAVGTTLLNLATWVDVALSGRQPSDAPDRTVDGVLRRLGADVPRDGGRPAAYGALGGIAAGLGIGVAASAARTAGLRLPAPVGAAVIGAAAMAASDVPMALTGVSDPSTWSRADWTRDAAAHLAYGVGVRWALDRATPPASEDAVLERPTGRLLRRCLALGAAAGSRSTLGIGGPAVAAPTPVTLLTSGLVLGELVADKLPFAPSRLQLPGLASRVVTGSVGAVALARREQRSATLPLLVGAAGAVAGSVGGAAWRDWAQQRGLTWQGAVAEDAVAVGLTAWACR
ncbi:hypothetical protein GCM10023340_31350 [Nocardioides marinquilinus]|uniref:DUF4126 domain-containing protein n=1 Tax=Nocardioides marinquilinus TaxID=1210400 RepID=A0ABP9PTH2_9ACTN